MGLLLIDMEPIRVAGHPVEQILVGGDIIGTHIIRGTLRNHGTALGEGRGVGGLIDGKQGISDIAEYLLALLIISG